MKIKNFKNSVKVTMPFIAKTIILLAIPALGGCSLITNFDKVMLLKRMSNNQREMENYVKTQESSFYKLRQDVKNNCLKKGMSIKQVSAAYLEPVLCNGKTCLYRHPSKYFNTGLVYLYFDEKWLLNSWELKEADAEKSQEKDETSYLQICE